MLHGTTMLSSVTLGRMHDSAVYPRNVSTSCLVELATDQVVTAVVRNITSSAPILFRNANVQITEL